MPLQDTKSPYPPWTSACTPSFSQCHLQVNFLVYLRESEPLQPSTHPLTLPGLRIPGVPVETLQNGPPPSNQPTLGSAKTLGHSGETLGTLHLPVQQIGPVPLRTAAALTPKKNSLPLRLLTRGTQGSWRGLAQGTISGQPGKPLEGFGFLRPPRQCNYSSNIKKKKKCPEIPGQLLCTVAQTKGLCVCCRLLPPLCRGRGHPDSSQTDPSQPAQPGPEEMKGPALEGGAGTAWGQSKGSLGGQETGGKTEGSPRPRFRHQPVSLACPVTARVSALPCTLLGQHL